MSGARRSDRPHLYAVADYTLGPEVILRFEPSPSGDYGWWCPDDQVVFVDSTLTGHQLAVTVLHEIGHMLCGDHAAAFAGNSDHERLGQWAESSASLLDLLRPGRRAVPA